MTNNPETDVFYRIAENFRRLSEQYAKGEEKEILYKTCADLTVVLELLHKSLEALNTKLDRR